MSPKVEERMNNLVRKITFLLTTLSLFILSACNFVPTGQVNKKKVQINGETTSSSPYY